MLKVLRPALGRKGDVYLPFLVSLFFYIFLMNLMELIPVFEFPSMSRIGFVVPLAGLAEEHGLDGTAGAQRFFDEADALDPHEAAFRGQAAAERHAKLLEPAIIAAAEERRLPGGGNVTHGSAGPSLWLHNG